MGERWQASAGAADVATLTIPADAKRERRFEIDCRFVVRSREEAASPEHGMRVYVDGAHEWSRRLPTQNPGATDSLDVHFTRSVPVGKPLRIVVRTEVKAAQRVSLTIEADEA